jgi:rod shape-determining protein MreC
VLLSFFGLKASGLKRSHAFFVLLKRFFTPSKDKLRRFFSFFFFASLCTYWLLGSSRESSVLNTIKATLTDISGPTLNLLNSPFRALDDYLKTNTSLRLRIQYLEQENQQLLEWKNTALKKERENKHLYDMLHVIPEVTVDFKTAKVLGTPNDYHRSTLIISAPKDTLLKKNFPVVCPKGVVGRIVETGLSTARVMLTTDAASRIPVRFESGEQAILAGQNTNELIVTHRHQNMLNHKDSLPTIQVGDVLVTSGFGGIYPPNLLVAIVSRVENERIFAKLPYETGNLEYVMILTHTFNDDLQ